MGSDALLREARETVDRLTAEGHVGDSPQCPFCRQPRPCRWAGVVVLLASLRAALDATLEPPSVADIQAVLCRNHDHVGKGLGPACDASRPDAEALAALPLEEAVSRSDYLAAPHAYCNWTEQAMEWKRKYEAVAALDATKPHPDDAARRLTAIDMIDRALHAQCSSRAQHGPAYHRPEGERLFASLRAALDATNDRPDDGPSTEADDAEDWGEGRLTAIDATNDGLLPPDRIESASRFGHSRHGHTGEWEVCEVGACPGDRAALDATNEPECARGSSGSATWCVTHDALWPSLSSKCEGWISTHRVAAPVDREEKPRG